MTITILCPNGHKLSCGEDRAGKRGKCPDCGATFRVPELVATKTGEPSSPTKKIRSTGGEKPDLPEDYQLQSEDKDHAGNDQAPTSTAIAETNQVRPYDEENDPPPNPDEIAFLCPEGHHLIGPHSLVGRAGECPVCSVKFLVPNPDELSDEEEAGAQEVINPLIFDFERGTSEVESDVDHEAAAAPSGLGPLFEALWRFKAAGASIELHLGEGKIIIPHGFARESAHQRYGLFVVREGNATHTLSAIAWDAIVRVAVRGLRNLPADVPFDFSG